jgi:D-glycerate 3-kinase
MERTPAALDVPLDPALLELFALPLLERLCRLAEAGQCPVVALNAPVGAGKTSLCRVLAQLALSRDLRLAVASIDDFYLPWPERSAAMAGNPFGVSRVPPGSHDPDLLCAVLDHWRAGGSLQLPRFDKTLRDGEGDRCARVVLEADALLLEGWLVGCRPLGTGLAAALTELSAAPGLNALALNAPVLNAPVLNAAERHWLPCWDHALRAYLPAWQRLDAVWLMRPLSWNLPRRWRFQAEARQRRRHGVGLTGAGLDQLVRASLCSLPPRLYLDPLLARLGQPGTPRWVDPTGASGLGASVRGAPVEAAAWVDGRRRLRCLAVSAVAGDPGVDSSVAIT